MRHLLSWLMVTTYCGNTDWGQGHAVRDMTSNDERWIWIVKDMDHCFVPVYPNGPAEGWEVDVLKSIVDRPFNVGGIARDPRKLLLRQLWHSDRQFRSNIGSNIDRLLDKRLTPAFLAERLRHYEGILDRYGESDRSSMAGIEDFFRHRPEIMRRQFDDLLTFREYRIERGRRRDARKAARR